MSNELLKTIGGVLILLLIIVGVGMGVKHIVVKDPKPIFTFGQVQKAYIGEEFKITWDFDKPYQGDLKLEFVDSQGKTTIFHGPKETGIYQWYPSPNLLNKAGALVITAGEQKDQTDNVIRVQERVKAKPDLQISAKFINSLICKNSDNQIEVIVKNIGDGIAKDFEVKLFPSVAANATEQQYVKAITALQPNSERTLFYEIRYSLNGTTSSIKAKLQDDANHSNNEKKLTARFSPQCSSGSFQSVHNSGSLIMPVQILTDLTIDTIFLEPGRTIELATTQSTVINKNFLSQLKLTELLSKKKIVASKLFSDME